MKTMKYRSVFSVLCTAALSVFLFTSCEKESDNVGGSGDGDRLEKFKRLEFTGSGGGATGSSTSSSGSGTFIGGGGGNISYIPPSGAGNSSQFAPTVQGGGEFTDPMSTSSTFAVSTPFSIGGGSFTLGSQTYQMDFGFCASSDLFDAIDSPGDDEDEVEIFIGVSGDFDIDGGTDDELDDLGIDLLLYVISYNGGSSIGDFTSFEGEGNLSNSAFVLAITNFDGDEDGDVYFANAGNVNFGGSTVSLSGLNMIKVEEGLQGENILGSTRVRASGALECGSFSFDIEEEGEL
ncbi:MAG: hypothetical protein RJQ00_11120 [Vicingaceae bacterium]